MLQRNWMQLMVTSQVTQDRTELSLPNHSGTPSVSVARHGLISPRWRITGERTQF